MCFKELVENAIFINPCKDLKAPSCAFLWSTFIITIPQTPRLRLVTDATCACCYTSRFCFYKAAH